MATEQQDEGVQEQMQEVLAVMRARTRGEATDKEVETAVARVLSHQNNGGGTASKKNGTASLPATHVVADTEDYDQLDDNSSKPPAKKKPRVANDTADPAADSQSPAYLQALDEIPLGRQGADMLTSFGDGPVPDPQTVSAALLGARKCLQIAVQDARALRRKKTELYAAAHSTMTPKKPQKPTFKEELDPELLYRATAKYDSLSYSRKCGFDQERLDTGASWRAQV